MRTKPAEVITDDAGARRLAALLNGDGRTRPTVVVTTPAGRAHPFIDVGDLLQHVGDVADIFVLETGPPSWAFSHAMAEGTHVYGGAGRVYPVGHDWVEDLRRSPIRFAFDADEGRRATERLVSDATAMAADAGLFEHARHRPGVRAPAVRTEVGGRVAGVPHQERAIVALDSRDLVIVVPELVVTGVPLSRLLVRDMRVRGTLDAGSRRLDLRGSLRPPEEALAGYRVGAVVLAEVVAVDDARARLRLHPQVVVDVARDAVTSNERDDLRSLVSVGEVLPARVSAAGPDWALVLLDVDDDEEVLPAPTLLPGGPPWLAESHPEPRVAPPASAPPVLPPPAVVPPAPEPPPAKEPEPSHGSVPRGAPSPLLLDPRRRRTAIVTARPDPAPVTPEPAPPTPPAPPAPPAPEPAAPVPVRPREEERRLQRELAATRAQLDETSHRLLDVVHERGLLHARMRELEEEARRAAEELRRLRTENRRRAQSRRTQEPSGPVFADPEQDFRYRVLTAWATRTPPAEQASRPLPDYDIGPDFLASLELPGVDRGKVADVVFEVVTGRAHEIPGRDLHQLRSGSGGGTASVRRDGATCWRAALQTNAPQARRLHYWSLPQGRIELSRVVLHDDMAP